MTETMSLDAAQDFADELVRQLGEVYGDVDAVNDVLNRWLNVLDGRFYAVAVTALHTTFARCLVATEPADVPPGAVRFNQTEGDRLA
jgi:hypothetical protein